MKDYAKIYEYLYTHVRRMYMSFDGGHDEHHFDEVYRAAGELAHHLNLSDDEVLFAEIAAAYHDVGRLINDQRHEEYSVIIFNNDYNMKSWLNQDEMQLVSNTIAEHRSNKGASTILSKILKDADKAYSIINRDRWITRIVRANVDRTNIPMNSPVFKSIITEKCMAKLSKVYKTTDWKLDVSADLFGPIPMHEIPTEEEVGLFIEKYIKEKEDKR